MAEREPLSVPVPRPDVAVIDATTPPTRPGGLRPWPVEVWLPVLTTLVGSLVVVLSGIRGADYPAHLLRAELWHRAGASVWNFYWYGGHPTPGYSVIVPPMADAIGAVPLCVLASVVATACFCLLTRDLLASRTTVWANIAFALAAVVDVVVGRVAFAVGLALGPAGAVVLAPGRQRRGAAPRRADAARQPGGGDVRGPGRGGGGRRRVGESRRRPRCGRGCAVPRSRRRWRRPPSPRWR